MSNEMSTEPEKDLQVWLGYQSTGRNWTTQDAKDFIDGFVEGLEASGIRIEPEPVTPWWRRLLRRS